MSMALNGSSQFAGLSSTPSASAFVMAGWFRRTSDSGDFDLALCVDDGTSFQRYAVYINTSDQWQGAIGFTQTASNRNAVVNDWVWMTIRFDGSTLTVRSCLDGETAFNTAVTASGSALTPDRFRIGASGAGGDYFPGTVACVKVWSGTLPSDTDLLAERLSISVTATTGLWANYDFLDGALATDRSGNGRTLTLTGTPTYTADKPNDLTIASGPTINTQPSAQTAIISEGGTATFTIAATTSGGPLTYDWELETSVGGGVYANVANGSGGTWTGQAAATLTGTFTATTLSGRRVRCNVTDDNGTTTSTAVTLTVRAGDAISTTSGTTNGSGVSTITFTSDAVAGNGVFAIVDATVGGVTKTVALRPATP